MSKVRTYTPAAAAAVMVCKAFEEGYYRIDKIQRKIAFSRTASLTILSIKFIMAILAMDILFLFDV